MLHILLYTHVYKKILNAYTTRLRFASREIFETRVKLNRNFIRPHAITYTNFKFTILD